MAIQIQPGRIEQCTMHNGDVQLGTLVYEFNPLDLLNLVTAEVILITLLLAPRRRGVGTPTAPRCCKSFPFTSLKPCTSWIEVPDTLNVLCAELQHRSTCFPSCVTFHSRTDLSSELVAKKLPVG